MSKEFILNKKKILPGQHEVIKLNVARLPSGTVINLRAHVFRSKNPGPTLLVMGGVHGDEIKAVGYHVRDYFVKQWDKFKAIHWTTLAHSTHVKGKGIFEDGIETPRIQVTLATQIPEDICELINLGYRDPKSIKIDDWRDKEDDGKLLVERAGEMLYRVRA